MTVGNLETKFFQLFAQWCYNAMGGWAVKNFGDHNNVEVLLNSQPNLHISLHFPILNLKQLNTILHHVLSV